jgi:hypothetical protein
MDKLDSNPSLLQDVADFVRHRKAWWLLPIIVLLALLGIVVVAGQGSVLAPFIYALF